MGIVRHCQGSACSWKILEIRRKKSFHRDANCAIIEGIRRKVKWISGAIVYGEIDVQIVAPHNFLYAIERRPSHWNFNWYANFNFSSPYIYKMCSAIDHSERVCAREKWDVVKNACIDCHTQ